MNEPGSELEIVGLGGTYEPSEPYLVTIRLLSFDMQAAGFQAAFRFANGPREGRAAGSARSIDGRTTVAGNDDGVDYVQHTAEGVAADGKEAEWTFEWTAPESPDRVWLHVAANSGNGDNSPLDDLVYTLRAQLTPSPGDMP